MPFLSNPLQAASAETVNGCLASPAAALGIKSRLFLSDTQPFFYSDLAASFFQQWIVGANINLSQQLAGRLDCGVVRFWHLTFGWLHQVSDVQWQCKNNTMKYCTGTVVCKQYFFPGSCYQLWKYLCVIYSSEDVTHEGVCAQCDISHLGSVFLQTKEQQDILL